MPGHGHNRLTQALAEQQRGITIETMACPHGVHLMFSRPTGALRFTREEARRLRDRLDELVDLSEVMANGN